MLYSIFIFIYNHLTFISKWPGYRQWKWLSQKKRCGLVYAMQSNGLHLQVMTCLSLSLLGRQPRLYFERNSKQMKVKDDIIGRSIYEKSGDGIRNNINISGIKSKIVGLNQK